MNISKNGFQFSTQLFYASLITFLMVTLLSACSSQSQSGSADQSPTSQGLVEPTLTPIPTLPPLDGKALLFEEGRYIRDEYCSMIFDYHMTAYGALTIGIADNLAEPRDLQALALKVVDRYSDLYTNSPALMNRPLTVFILSNPNVGECYSKDHLVFVAPDDLDSKSFIEELLGSGTGISEYWVQAGLSSLVLDEQPDHEALKTWYQNTDDLDMAGLFIARFHEDWATEEEQQIARMSATSLVQYALEVENIRPELLVEQVNNDVRTRWLASLGVHRTVTYPYDGRFAGFTYSQSNDCALLVQADSMLFCLNRLPEQESFDEISEAEFLIDHAYYGRKTWAEYLISEAPSVIGLMNPEETTDHLVPTGHTHGDATSLQNSDVHYYVFHEIFHSFNMKSLLDTEIAWLAVGFDENMMELLPFYQQIEKDCAYEELSGRLQDADSSTAPETSFCNFLDAEQFEAAQAWYLAQGGQLQSEEYVDLRLYTDAVAFATMHRHASGSQGATIGEMYETAYPDLDLENLKGMELTPTQSASFLAWLSDTYSIDRVLNVYINHAEDGLLDGKTYEELKSDWLADLLSKGPGIDIPGKP